MRIRQIKARNNRSDTGEVEIDCEVVENLQEAYAWIARMSEEETIKFVNRTIAFQTLYKYHSEQKKKT